MKKSIRGLIVILLLLPASIGYSRKAPTRKLRFPVYNFLLKTPLFIDFLPEELLKSDQQRIRQRFPQAVFLSNIGGEKGAKSAYIQLYFLKIPWETFYPDFIQSGPPVATQERQIALFFNLLIEKHLVHDQRKKILWHFIEDKNSSTIFAFEKLKTGVLLYVQSFYTSMISQSQFKVLKKIVQSREPIRRPPKPPKTKPRKK